MTEVHHNTRAQLNRAQIRATAENATRWDGCRRAKVRMDIAVVCLEEAKAKAVRKKRQVIVHAAANRHSRTPSVGIVITASVRVGTAQVCPANEAMREESEIIHRSPEYGTGRPSVETVIHAVRMGSKLHLGTNILIEIVGNAT